MSNDNSVHYFSTSVVNWTVAPTLEECRARQEKADRSYRGVLPGFRIWEVPLPIEAEYQIKEYVPQVEGAKEVLRVRYEG